MDTKETNEQAVNEPAAQLNFLNLDSLPVLEQEKRAPITLDQVIWGDCQEVLAKFPDQCVDLIVTSPPYADQRKNTYGGISPDQYVNWWMPKPDEF